MGFNISCPIEIAWRTGGCIHLYKYDIIDELCCRKKSSAYIMRTIHGYLVLYNLTGHEGLSWSWSYGSWIYNLYNQFVSALKVVSSNPAHDGDVLDTILCDKVCEWLATGRCLSQCTPICSTNKTDHGSYWTNGSYLGLVEVITSKVLRSPPWLG